MSQDYQPVDSAPDWRTEALERVRDALSDFWLAGQGVFPATVFFAVIILISTLGYIALGWPPFDAFYMVVITVFSVGYGETQPVDTLAERLWTILVIFGGWSAVVVTLGGLTKAITGGELRRVTDTIRKTRVMEHLHNHIIVCGYGRMGQTLARELRTAGVQFIIVDRDEEKVAQITTDGFLGHRGDATEEGVLESCGIKRARILATVLPQDAVNVYITLTARNLRPDMTIIARGEHPSTEKKLMQAGASEVVLPSTICGQRFAQSILKPEVSRLLHEGGGGLDLKAFGVEVDELVLRAGAEIAGQTVRDVHRLSDNEIMVIGVRRGHTVLRDDVDSIVLQEGDALIAMSRGKNLPAVIVRACERMMLSA